MIVIVGGGICGLSIGWRLAQAGRPVTIVERGETGMAATWAAAGMLAPQVEAEHGEESLLPLILESRNMWDEFATELEQSAGMNVDYRQEGTLVVALDRDDREYLERRFEYLRGLYLDLEWLSGRDALQREPHLAPAVNAGILSPLDHQVDNRKVVAALKAAFLGAGGTLHEGCEVLNVVMAAGRASGVEVADGDISAEEVVIAAGAWSRNIGGLPDSVRPPVRPLKGQMLALQMDRAAPLIQRVVWGTGYLPGAAQ